MKTVGAFLIILSASLFGICARMALKNRQKALSSVLNALSLLKSETELSHMKLKDALMRCGKDCDIFSECGKNLDKGIRAAWRQSVFGAKNLTQSDKEILALLGDRLGMSDILHQSEGIDYVAALITDAKRGAEENYKKYARLYSSAGVLFGAALIILLMR